MNTEPQTLRQLIETLAADLAALSKELSYTRGADWPDKLAISRAVGYLDGTAEALRHWPSHFDLP